MVSQLKVNEIIKQSGSSITIGEDGDTVSGPFTNTPNFQVRNGGTGQTLSSGTDTKLTAFDTADFDTAGGWSASDSKYTVQTGKAGKYIVYAQIKYGGSSTRRLMATIFKNGSAVTRCANNVDYYAGVTVSSILDLAVGDYLELYGKLDNGGGGSVGTATIEEFFGAYRLTG